MAKLEVRNLSISFRTNNGAVRAVRDISFDLNEGETLAIAGESGSGKSVTTRAVMGILAGNAMVDNGTIIYDGKDLLKIPEEEFHTLRGHKLSMVFQDPLSALNPIMRIGKQLTEAMILNNKERREDGKKRFNALLAELKKAMIAAKGEAARAEVEAKAKKFDDFNVTGIKLEQSYTAAKESMVETLDCIEELDLALLKQDVKSVDDIVSRLTNAGKRVSDPYLYMADAGLNDALTAMTGLKKKFSMKQESELRGHMDTVKTILNGALEKDEPNFFCLGYQVHEGQTVDHSKPIAQLNAEARKTLDEGFMNDFLKDIQAGLAWSEEQSRKATGEAVAILEKNTAVFEAKELDVSACREAIKRCAEAVQKSIDPLKLDKDSQAYVFKSSMESYLARYQLSLKHNPKEEKRFAADTGKYNKLKAAGKFAPSVVPKNLIDTERVRANMVNTMKELTAHFKDLIAAQTHDDDAETAVAIVDFLKARAADAAYHLTQGMAKHRAIELMKEVGIPEPHKRYGQYPFEFSGGMRQRIVIAIALSANPDILICDEPTTALDVTIQAQILELINRLKKERKLSVIFITHDLGVVANMADRIAIMYAGKIVEYGTADDVFYDPKHPYTWALLASMPDLETHEKLEAIPGTPPNMILPPKGDAFAARNKYAMQIDFEEQPPMFRVSETHSAATWLLHPNAPKVEPPAIVTERIRRMKRKEAEGGAQA